MNIYQKISEVMKRINYLQKDDSVEFNSIKYKALSEEKVTSIIRKELIDLGIVIIPIKQERSTTELVRTEKSVNQRTDVDVEYRIQNIDDINDYIIASSSGSGVDTQDKGVGKAMTYSYKYLLLRTFAIPTGEDPDKISSAKIDNDIEKEIEKEKQEHEIDRDMEKIIDKTKEEALREVIKNNALSTEYVLETLKTYGYKKLADIKIKDYMNIHNDFSEV